VVGENTFRTPWLHRHLMSERAALAKGVQDAKTDGFVPGGIRLHDGMLPRALADALAVLFETGHRLRPTARALQVAQLQ